MAVAYCGSWPKLILITIQTDLASSACPRQLTHQSALQGPAPQGVNKYHVASYVSTALLKHFPSQHAKAWQKASVWASNVNSKGSSSQARPWAKHQSATRNIAIMIASTVGCPLGCKLGAPIILVVCPWGNLAHGGPWPDTVTGY